MFSSTFESSPSDHIETDSVSYPHHVNRTNIMLPDVRDYLDDFFNIKDLSICNQHNMSMVILHLLLNFDDIHQRTFYFSNSEISFKALDLFDCSFNILISVFNAGFVHFFVSASETNYVEARVDR